MSRKVSLNDLRTASMKLLLVMILLTGVATWRVIDAAAPGVPEISMVERAAIDKGAELERSRLWGDAIDHYKHALENWPENNELTYGLRRSKFHFSIDRRYSDNSFTDQMLSLNPNEAFQLLSEVYNKIQVYYVEPVQMSYFIAHGTESLYLALNNERFVSQHIPNADPRSVMELRKDLREQFWNKPVSSFSQAQQVILDVARRANTLTGMPQTPVIMEYLFGGCNALDDYSRFLTPGKLMDLYSNINGEFVGLGIEMKAETDKGVLLVNVLPDSPAESGGLEPGDYILSIDGHDCRPLSTEEAAGFLTGKSGSRVLIEWKQATSGQTKRASFTRREVKIRSIPLTFMVNQQQGIGYIKLTGFQKSTGTELDEALSALHAKGMKSVILDLRGNPGGLLSAAVDVLDRFVDQGVLVSTKGRMSDQDSVYSAHQLGTWNVDLILLVDENSASASEVVAGAIRDHNRGLLIGNHTYGKWSVQSIYDVSMGTGIKLSTAKYYSPHGHWFGGTGLRPDFFVEAKEEGYRRVTEQTLREDPVFEKAVDLLENHRMSLKSLRKVN